MSHFCTQHWVDLAVIGVDVAPDETSRRLGHQYTDFLFLGLQARDRRLDWVYPELSDDTGAERNLWHGGEDCFIGGATCCSNCDPKVWQFSEKAIWEIQFYHICYQNN